MPLGISDDHAELSATLRKWGESLSPREAARDAEETGASLADWIARAGEMGLCTIAAPGPHGGGGSLLDQAVALEAAAHALVPGPMLATTLAALLGAGDGSGAWGFTSDGLAPDAGASSVDLTQGVQISAGGGITFDAAGELLAATMAAAEASGLARWCLDTAVEYAGVREQFGRQIGSFQSIKHLCAEMLERSESITAAAWDAAQAADAGDQQQWEMAVLVARTLCFDGAVQVAHACIQVLGGIGFTFEHDAHLYLRRAIALRALFGGSSRWAGSLATLAATGVRRSLEVDLSGRDATIRPDLKAAAERVAKAADQRAALVEERLLAPHWPAPYGRTAEPVEQLVIDQELEAAGVTRPDLKIGGWAAPTIMVHGNDAQRERFLTPTLTGEITWCQLFSEPGAGSDLASLRTKAVRTTGGWKLSGQKVWTSLAREAQWGIALARTTPLEDGGKPHAGITYFLIDMTSPGIDIRPLRELTGEAMFNEVFLDEVFVPDECVVGEVDGGWRLAVATLANERVAMAGSRLGDSVERALDLLGDNPASGNDIGRAVAWATVTKLLATRATLRTLAGQGPGAESSIAKLVGVRSRQDSAELVVDLLGRRIFSDDELARAALHEQLLTRCLSIAGGTTQILRNVVGERLLGLPR